LNSKSRFKFQVLYSVDRLAQLANFLEFIGVKSDHTPKREIVSDDVVMLVVSYLDSSYEWNIVVNFVPR
jgi:hypothetical protein